MTAPYEISAPAELQPHSTAGDSRSRRLWGRLSPTAWALTALLVATAVLYLWGLSASGYANSFYSAAAQAGADNWKAFLFGSSDMAGSITVDKPPASIWVMALSVKIFGLNSWAMLVPQALMGVASVGLLFATVRRWYGDAAGLLAGAVLAITPIAVLMFRFNNPDALLVLLLIGAAYCVVRAMDGGRLWWMVGAGALIGFAFLTKSMQAFLVLPGFVVAYGLAGPGGWGRRLRDLLVAFAAMIVAGGWWVALVELWPASDRPYIGGSQSNSALDLILGYNGFGRLTGNETGSVGGGGGPGGNGGSMWGETGIGRMFDGSWAGGIAWLLLTSAALIIVGLILTGRQSRLDKQRAGIIIWGGWLIVTWLTFSFASGIIHEYYAVALAPAIAALVGGVGLMLWKRRDETLWRWVLAVGTTLSVLYGAWLLTRAGGGYVLAGAALATIAILVGLALAFGSTDHKLGRWIGLAAATALLAGPLVFSVQTAATAHTGSLPTAGPALAGARSGPGGRGGGPGGGFAGAQGQQPPSLPGTTGTTGTAGQLPGGGGGPGGGAGGLLDASTPSTELVDTLSQNADSYEWVAAAIGSQNASGYQLATGYSVMPIGGFNGSDPSPTLDQFKQWVDQGKIHYFIASGGGMGGPGGGAGGAGSSSEISSWVEANYTTVTVGGVTLYDLTQPA